MPSVESGVDLGTDDFAPLRDRLTTETNKLAGRGWMFDAAAWWAAVQAIADHAYQLGLADRGQEKVRADGATNA